MKIGITIKLDVLKIDKARLYKGSKGTYLDLTTFINTDEKDQYDNNGFVTQSPTKEEREAKEKLPILGNVRVFYAEGGQRESTPEPATTGAPADDGDFDDDIPF
jgi:hypothetical protein